MAIKLNLGSSKNWKKEGWATVDHRIAGGKNELTKRGDAANIPLESNSCSVVFTSHMFEHIPHYKLPHALLEINRILETGGVLRILTPDLKKVTKAYVNQDNEFFQRALEEDENIRTDLGYGGMLMNFIVSPGQDTALFSKDLTQFIGGYAHIYLYDFEMLKILLENAGFGNIEQMAFCESTLNELKEPFHVVGLEPVWQNMNKKFYDKHKLKHIYSQGNYTINFAVTGFDRDPITSLIVEARKEKDIKKEEYDDFNGENCKNYNRYGFSLLEDNEFKKKVEINTKINKLINIKMESENTKKVKIKDKWIGAGESTFIIAEIGINHNGDINMVKKLIDMAVFTGCDAVKFQKRTIELVYTSEELVRPRENPFGATNGDLKRGLEFGEKEYMEIDRYCKEKGIMWFASPWDVKSVDFLEKFDVPCYKIASPSLTDDELLRHIRSKGRPIILSTGMSTVEEIRHAVDVLGEKDLVLLHCTSTYPSKIEELNLSVIPWLRKTFDCPIGYSSHATGIIEPVIAATLGASVVETHITLDRAMWGSDQAASLEANGLNRVVRDIRSLPKCFGDGIKRVYESEKPILKKLRKSSN